MQLFNYSFWIYPQHQATMREVRYKVYLTVYSPRFSIFVKVILKYVNIYVNVWKTVVQACKRLKSLFKKPWGSSKEVLLIYFYSLPDERGENKISQFLSFSVYFWKFWMRQGCLSFYGSHKGEEGADADLMFQFCLPNSVLLINSHWSFVSKKTLKNFSVFQ